MEKEKDQYSLCRNPDETEKNMTVQAHKVSLDHVT